MNKIVNISLKTQSDWWSPTSLQMCWLLVCSKRLAKSLMLSRLKQRAMRFSSTTCSIKSILMRDSPISRKECWATMKLAIVTCTSKLYSQINLVASISKGTFQWWDRVELRSRPLRILRPLPDRSMKDSKISRNRIKILKSSSKRKPIRPERQLSGSPSTMKTLTPKSITTLQWNLSISTTSQN